MKIIVKPFSIFRDLLEGKKEIIIELPGTNSCVKDVIDVLSKYYPKFREFLSKSDKILMITLLNGEHVDMSHSLEDRDELAIIVPPSGG